MKKAKYNLAIIVLLVLGIFLGFSLSSDDPKRGRINDSKINEPNVPKDVFRNLKYQTDDNGIPNQSYGYSYFSDDFNGSNDTTSLKSRGYKIYYRGTGTQGTSATWFQGNNGNFPAFNGPATGYVAADFNAATNTNKVDNWLVLPKKNIAVSDSLFFYSRSQLNSSFPDSIRVMYSASGDSVPEAGSWVELERFKVNTGGIWEKKGFRANTAGPNARFAIRYAIVDGGPSGSNSDYIGIDALTIESPALLNDVGIIDNDENNFLVDSILQAPKATLVNFGTNNQSNVPVTFKINGPTNYTSTKLVNVNSGDSVKITFDSTFNPLDTGTYNITIYSSLGSDQNRPNDTINKPYNFFFRDGGSAYAGSCRYFFANSQAATPRFPSRPTYSWKNDLRCQLNLIKNGVNQVGSSLVGHLDDGYFKLKLSELQSRCNAVNSKKIKLCGVCYDSLFIGTNGIIGFTNRPTGTSPATWDEYPSGWNNSSFPGNYRTPAIYPLYMDLDFSLPGSTGGVNSLSCGITNNQLIITYYRAKVFGIIEYVSFQVCYDLVSCPSLIDPNIKFSYGDVTNGRTSAGFIARYRNSDLLSGPTLLQHIVGIAPTNPPDPLAPQIMYRKTDLLGYMGAPNWFPLVVNRPLIRRPLYNILNRGLAIEFGPNPNDLDSCHCDPGPCEDTLCVTNNFNMSTGFNHNLGIPYPNEGWDGNWQLVSSPLALLPQPAGVLGNPVYWGSQLGSKWLTVNPLNVQQPGNTTIPYIYETRFCLCYNSSNINFQFGIMADNSATIWLDGLEITGAWGIIGFSAPTPVSFSRTLTQGEHILQIRVINLGGPTGMNLSGNITGNNIQTRRCCRNNGITTGLTGSGEAAILSRASLVLMNPLSPYNPIDTALAFSDSIGNLTLQFSNSIPNGSYYFVIKSKNTIETWSATPQSITGDSLSFDFTTSLSQSYGNNMILVNGKWCFYSGDVNQDGIIDASDLSLVDNAAFIGLSGDVVEDLNGDEFVDASDLSIVDNNAYYGVSVRNPIVGDVTFEKSESKNMRISK